jgi:hypothetical protein
MLARVLATLKVSKGKPEDILSLWEPIGSLCALDSEVHKEAEELATFDTSKNIDLISRVINDPLISECIL